MQFKKKEIVPRGLWCEPGADHFTSTCKTLDLIPSITEKRKKKMNKNEKEELEEKEEREERIKGWREIYLMDKQKPGA